MSSSIEFQNRITEKLREFFQEVEKEWSITKNATDAFSVNVNMYAPRLDVAVGPFSVDEGNLMSNMKNVFENKAPQTLKDFVVSKQLSENRNPRCMLAIEVAYSGSSKHFLGDITNASMIGLYGFVIASDSTFNELKRIFEYSNTIKRLNKAPQNLFSNVCVIKGVDFLRLLSSE